MKNVLDVKKLYDHALKARVGAMFDGQVPGTPSIYGDEVMEKLLVDLLPVLEQATGLELRKTYTYFRVYKTGDILRIHADRPSCEVSMSLCLGYDSDYSWPLYVMSYSEEPMKTELRPGDALVYKGVQMKHWRPKFKGNHHAQVFLHYVEANGVYAEWENDKRAMA